MRKAGFCTVAAMRVTGCARSPHRWQSRSVASRAAGETVRSWGIGKYHRARPNCLPDDRRSSGNSSQCGMRSLRGLQFPARAGLCNCGAHQVFRRFSHNSTATPAIPARTMSNQASSLNDMPPRSIHMRRRDPATNMVRLSTQSAHLPLRRNGACAEVKMRPPPASRECAFAI